MNVHPNEQLYRCGNELAEDFNLQFGQVNEQMSNRLDVLKNKLISNCVSFWVLFKNEFK